MKKLLLLSILFVGCAEPDDGIDRLAETPHEFAIRMCEEVKHLPKAYEECIDILENPKDLEHPKD